MDLFRSPKRGVGRVHDHRRRNRTEYVPSVPYVIQADQSYWLTSTDRDFPIPDELPAGSMLPVADFGAAVRAVTDEQRIDRLQEQAIQVLSLALADGHGASHLCTGPHYSSAQDRHSLSVNGSGGESPLSA